MPTIESDRTAPRSFARRSYTALPAAAVLDRPEGPSREGRPSVVRRVIAALAVVPAADRRRLQRL